ncbi:hypothetical protein ACWFQ8_12595 [Streptomyces sp. NPDC055254]
MAPAAVRGLTGLTGLSAELHLKTIREHYPDPDRISDDVLVAHGNALCAARYRARPLRQERVRLTADGGTPAERLRPEPAHRRVIDGLDAH